MKKNAQFIIPSEKNRTTSYVQEKMRVFSMHVFGYGSLLWNPNFPYINCTVGYIFGYSRRFCQASPDHRGTEQNPGRVVTLVPEEKNAKVWGITYSIATDKADEVREYLNYRERAGYIMVTEMFHPADGSPMFPVNIYISCQIANPMFCIGESLEQIAERIINSKGRSGSNVEYILKLAQSLRKLHPNAVDKHTAELESLVVKLCLQRKLYDKSLIELCHTVQSNFQ
ncbi:Cation transport regulator-like protein 2 [Trichinella zimbabwensis]|uniref:glutathione-specific gamma-glutamylcyclotransferase n=1 Tax=Trichinella zimbabwensis TaxID=268475 RepID=A0A0V1HE63_9BILA|nr:Cation transport regulator-like protein 2 [Trichinella zimbabwensis]